jgi:glutamate racemase
MHSTHLVLTDSGLGGLSICAALEREAREAGPAGHIHITYVNAWPEEGRGYNDLPDAAARATAFDRVLAAIDGLSPDGVLIACNTLSILYERTRHRAAAHVPVQGIVDAGVDLFAEALAARPGSAIVLVGTRTTIESDVHRQRLVARDVAPARIGAASCHGLATAIERGPESAATDALIATCAANAAAVAPPGNPLFLGLCCTHYAWVAPRLVAALAATTGRAVEALDPNARLVRDVGPRLMTSPQARECRPDRADLTRPAPESGGTPGARERVEVPGPVAFECAVRVISKVALSASQREAVASLVRPISPATAEALRDYNHVPDLF